VQLAELPFPIRHPLVKRIFQVIGRGEEMDVVGHNNVVANEPLGRTKPYLLETSVNKIIGQPGFSVRGA
jgi:hypothetical protein